MPIIPTKKIGGIRYEKQISLFMRKGNGACKASHEKLDKKYPNILKSWDKNWSELTTFLIYPTSRVELSEIRKIMHNAAKKISQIKINA